MKQLITGTAKCNEALDLSGSPCRGIERHFGTTRASFSAIRVCQPGPVALPRSLSMSSGKQRQDATPGLAKMYRVPTPPAWWWPAAGAPLERGVTRHLARPVHEALRRVP